MLNLAGMRFGMLEAICVGEPIVSKSGRKRITWDCICDCGNTTTVTASNLKHATKSCGCVKGAHRVTHNMSNSRLYAIWNNLKGRCLNPNDVAYDRYGGRGLAVCEEWLVFDNFYSWSVENGYSENLTIDRIDNDKGYSPCNCRFASKSVQSANRRKEKNTSSKFIGVYFHKDSKKFASHVTFEGKSKYLGLFLCEQEAAKARNTFIIEHNLPNTLNNLSV